MENNNQQYSQVSVNSPPPIEMETDSSFPGMEDSVAEESIDSGHSENGVTNRVPRPDHMREEIPFEDESEGIEEGQEESFESPVHKATKDRAKHRIQQLSREKYQALHQLEIIQQENERIRRDYELSSRVAMQAHDSKVMSDIDKARKAKADALESGDINAQVDADTQLALAINEYKKVEDWKAEQNYNNQYNQHARAPVVNTNAEREYAVESWTNQREFLHPESPRFDRDLAYETQNFSQRLDDALYQRGESHLIGSPQYFDYVDQHINILRENGNYKNQGRSDLNMRPSRQSVSPVRNGFSQGRGQSVKISADERDMIRRLGVSEKEYVRRKALDQRHENDLRRGR